MDSLGVLYEEVRDGSTFPLVRCGSVPLALSVKGPATQCTF